MTNAPRSLRRGLDLYASAVAVGGGSGCGGGVGGLVARHGGIADGICSGRQRPWSLDGNSTMNDSPPSPRAVKHPVAFISSTRQLPRPQC